MSGRSREPCASDNINLAFINQKTKREVNQLIKANFHYAIFAIVGLSLIPMIYEYILNKIHPDVAVISTTKLKKIIKQPFP